MGGGRGVTDGGNSTIKSRFFFRLPKEKVFTLFFVFYFVLNTEETTCVAKFSVCSDFSFALKEIPEGRHKVSQMRESNLSNYYC